MVDHDNEHPFDDVHLMALLDNFRGLPEEAKERLLRLMDRLAALPVEVQASLTMETIRTMLDNDSDYPYN